MFLDCNSVYIKDLSSQPSTMFTDEQQDRLFEVEDKSWWFQYRAKVIKKIASLFFDKNIQTVDIGGGNGYTTSVLEKDGFNMCLLEPSYQACLNGKKRNLLNVINGSIDDLENSNSQFTLLDVLEHIEDDGNFLDSILRKMSDCGMILITVPAFMSLWSDEDMKAGHFRRYKKGNLIKLLKNHGYTVVYSNYFFSFLYIPIYLVRVLYGGLFKGKSSLKESDKTPGQLQWGNSVIDFLVGLIERIEIKSLLSKKRIPFGSSIIVVARK